MSYLAAAQQQKRALPYHSTVTIPDDAAVSFDIGAQFVNVQFSDGSYLHASMSPAFNSITLIYSSASVGTLTTVLTGTNGPDGHIQIGIGDNKAYIQNRTGAALDAVIRSKAVD